MSSCALQFVLYVFVLADRFIARWVIGADELRQGLHNTIAVDCEKKNHRISCPRCVSHPMAGCFQKTVCEAFHHVTEDDGS